MKHILNSIVNELVESGVIKESDSAIYYFGLYEGGIFVFNVLLTLVIASVIQNLWIGIVFFLSFFPVRRYAGGFHAKTRLGCFCASIFIVISAMMGLEIIDRFSIQNLFLSFILIAIFILILAPVQNSRKILNVTEIKMYKKKLVNVLSVECISGICLGMFGAKSYVATIVISLVVCLGLSVGEVLVKN